MRSRAAEGFITMLAPANPLEHCQPCGADYSSALEPCAARRKRFGRVRFTLDSAVAASSRTRSSATGSCVAVRRVRSRYDRAGNGVLSAISQQQAVVGLPTHATRKLLVVGRGCFGGFGSGGGWAVEEEVGVLEASEVVVGSAAVEQGGAGNSGDHDTRRSR